MRKLTLRVVGSTGELEPGIKEHTIEVGGERKLRVFAMRYSRTMCEADIQGLSQRLALVVENASRDSRNIGLLMPDGANLEVLEEDAVDAG